MAHNYEPYLDKLVLDCIEEKAYMVDALAGIKEISGKLDTLIALAQVVVQRLPQMQEPQQRQC